MNNEAMLAYGESRMRFQTGAADPMRPITDAIDRAVLLERERCAELVDQWAEGGGDPAAWIVARDIRMGVEPRS